MKPNNNNKKPYQERRNIKDVHQEKADLQIQINKNKVNIDKECFVKSEEEKSLLKTMKSLHKKSLLTSNN